LTSLTRLLEMLSLCCNGLPSRSFVLATTALAAAQEAFL
jgi:hypothetical protein